MGTAQALLDKVDCSFDHRKAFSAYQGYVFQYIGSLFVVCVVVVVVVFFVVISGTVFGLKINPLPSPSPFPSLSSSRKQPLLSCRLSC